MKKYLVSVLVAFLALSLNVYAQNSYRGQVIDRITADPVGFSEVWVINLSDSSSKSLVTGEDGKFTFDLKEGSYLVQVYHLSYSLHEFVRSIPYKGTDVISISMKENMLEEAIVQGTRAKRNAPTTFKNLDKKDIDENNFGQDLPFVIGQTPSTVVTSDAGAGVGYTGIRLRGIDATRINVTINGFPYNDAESQGVYWVNMPDLASSISSMQIQRGVGTSTNGSAAFGGSINVKTDHVNEDPFSRVDVGYGSFNTIRRSVQFGTGILKSGFGIQGRYSQISSDGYIDRSAADLSSLYLTAVYRKENSSFKFNIIRGHERTEQAWFGIPQTYFEQGNKAESFISNWSAPTQENMRNSDPKKFNFYTYENQVDNYNQDHYQGFYTRTWGANTSLNVGVNYTRGIGYFEEYHDVDIFWQETDLATYGIDPVISGSDTVRQSDLIRRLWLDNHFIGSIVNFSHKSAKLNTQLGGGFHNYRGLHYGEVIWARYASNSEKGERFYKNDAQKQQGNVYLKLDNEPMNRPWIYMLDLQLRTVNYAFVGPDRNNNLTDRKESFLFFNPKAGVTRQFENAIAYASVAQSSREPVRNDFVNSSPNSLPKPEQMIDFEAGYKFEGRFNKTKERNDLLVHPFSKLTMNVNVYYMLYQDQLVPTGQINDVGVSTRTNVDQSFRRGIEIDGTYQFLQGKLAVGGNATLSENKIVEFTEYVTSYDGPEPVVINWKNTPIAYSPSFISAAFAEYAIFKDLRLRYQFKYVSRQYLDNTGTESRSLDPFSVSDVRATYTKNLKSGTKVEIGFQVNNLIGNVYVPNGYTDPYFFDGVRASDNYFYPQAPRNYLIRVAYTL